MKTGIKHLLITLTFFAFFLNHSFGQGQVIVQSTNGYSVKITISNMVLNKYPYSGNETGGCNYTITMNYSVQFSGSNLPGSLWTLQGYVKCNQSNYFALPLNGGSGTVTTSNASYTGNPATLTLTSICKTIDIVINGPGISNKTVTIPIGGPLPIELLDFKAQASGQQVNLSWSTGSERDNDYFTIEKTTDGINYVAVAKVEAAGSSATQKDYTYTDYNPSAGTSYYRLKQTDYNGDSETFDAVSVEVAKTAVISKVYPNPATDSRINVTVSERGAVVDLNLYNVYGQLVSTQTVDATFGQVTQTIELPENGNMFFVELIQNGELIARHKVLTSK